MGKTFFRLATAGLIASAATGLGLSGGKAEAAAVPAAAMAHVQVVPNALQCGWTPANDANASGSVKSSLVVGNIYMFRGPDYGCGHISPDPGAVNGWGITVHCGWYNSNEGLWWDYLTLGIDPAHNMGWIPDKDVTWSGKADGC